jgi:hypothetical protein
MDGRLIFLHQSCGRLERRCPEGDRPVRSGRPARARAYTIPKSPERQPRKTSGRLKQADPPPGTAAYPPPGQQAYGAPPPQAYVAPPPAYPPTQDGGYQQQQQQPETTSRGGDGFWKGW